VISRLTIFEVFAAMRDLRYTNARLRVSKEEPFFPSKRSDPAQIGELFA